MQKTASARHRRVLSRMFYGMVAAALAACHHANSAPDVASAPAALAASGNRTSEVPKSYAFGDTVAFPVRVLAFDRAAEAAEVFIRQPDNVIVLGVEPGRGIEVIFPGSMTFRKQKSNQFTFFMQRFELTLSENAPAAGESTNARRAYEQCLRNRTALLREAVQRVRRDSTGKIISSPDPVIGREPPTCDLISEGGAAGHLTRRALPPRPERERYLVILSSSDPVTAAELEERMEGLSTIAPDVALTIEAIAAGIYVGKSGTYGGTFVAW